MNSHTILEKYFGFRDFRPGQRQIVESISKGRDVFALMQTGGGKSLCFQVPALSLEGTCLVICPLISLMNDQVKQLKRKRIEAEYLNSQQDYKERKGVENKLTEGKLKFLYVAPERFLTESFFDLIKQINISMIVFDEAHVITEWGEGFRPGYILALHKIKELERFHKQRLLNPSFRFQKVVLSASIIANARKDIIEKTALVRPAEFIYSFARPNIHLRVIHYHREHKDKLTLLCQDIKSTPNAPIIVYAATRKECEAVAGKLSVRNINATFYHAGMPTTSRKQKMQLFMKEKVDVIVCTSAFGMGIDKSNVRKVYHWNLPSTIEDMYQEMGRAGRDGMKSEHIVFYDEHDIEIAKQRLLRNYPTSEAVNKMHQFISIYSAKSNESTIEENKEFLADIVGTPITKETVSSTLDHLLRVGFLTEFRQAVNPNSETDKKRIFEINLNVDDIQLDSVDKRFNAATIKLQRLAEYFSTEGCRSKKILSYLGEPKLERMPHTCGYCDVCIAPKRSLPSSQTVTLKEKTSNDNTYKRLKGLVTAFAKEKKIPTNVIVPPALLSKLSASSAKTEDDLKAIGLSDKTIKSIGKSLLKIISEK